MSRVHEIGVRVKPSAAHYEKLTIIFQADCTDAQAAEIVGLSVRSVARWRNKCGLPFYVVRWVAGERGRLVIPVWRIGRKANAERPGPKETAAERMARLRAERKKE